MLPRLKEVWKFTYKSLMRRPLRMLLQPLANWEPLSRHEPGYTIVIAGMHQLWPVAVANLRLVSQCDQTNLREVILVMDQTLEQLPDQFKEQVSEIQSLGLNVRLLGYNPSQLRISRGINWGWVYSWLSWSIGIANAETRWVLLHDLDAMPIDPDIFRRLASAAVEANCQFQGVRYYTGNGVTADMRLVTTFEMVANVEWLRGTAKPIDCFNQIQLENGQYVDFDTLLEVQRRAPSRRVESVGENSLVHPTQLICQFTDLVAGRKKRFKKGNRLPVLLYFMHLGNRDVCLETTSISIADVTKNEISIFGKELDISEIEPSGWAWMEKQIRRLEQSLHGRTRPHIQHYLRGFAARAGDERSVGKEDIHSGGVPDY